MAPHRFPSIRGFLPLLVAAPSLLFLGACAKKVEVATPPPSTVDLVQAPERSQYFEAVNKHLELGGTLYGFVDVDGDAVDFAASMQRALSNLAATQPQLAALAKPDLKALFQDIGLTDIKAVGLSSVRREDGLYRNRVFIYTPEGRHGLLAVFGGKPAPFEGAALAPADVDFYAEHEIDVAAVYNTVKLVISKVAGPEAAGKFEEEVKSAGAREHFSLLDLLEGLQGRAVVFMRMDSTKNVTVPGTNPATLPETSVLVRIDGIGPAVEPLLADPSMNLVASTEGDFHLYTAKGKAPFPEFRYVVAVREKQLYLATSADFLHECLKRTDGLGTNPAFKAALASLGPDGNGLTWITPRFFSRIRETATANAGSNPSIKNVMDTLLTSMPEVNEPLLSVRTNQDDGILIRSTWNRSLKADLAMLTVYNPITVGLVAAMAIPAFQKVRSNSQAKAITNNLRMLSAAADQYYLEKGVDSATYDDLVGPDKYVKEIQPVAGENYKGLVFHQGRPLRVRLPDGRVFQFPYAAPLPRPHNRIQGGGSLKLDNPAPAANPAAN